MWAAARDYLTDVGRDMLGGWAIKTCGATVVAFLSGLLGGWDRLASGLFLLVTVDFVLGFSHGWRDGCLSRAKLLRGLAKFFLYAAAILTATTLDDVLNVKAEAILHIDFRAGMVMYLSINETLSILGHLSAFGVSLPQKLIQRLKDYRDCSVFTGKSRKRVS